MLSAFLILIVSALLCAALGFMPGRVSAMAALPALLGTAIALAVSLYSAGDPSFASSGPGSGQALWAPEGGVITGRPAEWPGALSWLGDAIYQSDALSAGLGAWCLMLGGLYLLKAGAERASPPQLAIGTLIVACLYGLVHASDLLVFTGHMLFLLLMVWASMGAPPGIEDWRPGDGRQAPTPNPQPPTPIVLPLGLGVVALLSATLLIARTMGGTYRLASLSLAALTPAPLALLALFVALWLCVAPLTGALRAERGAPRHLGGMRRSRKNRCCIPWCWGCLCSH